MKMKKYKRLTAFLLSAALLIGLGTAVYAAPSEPTSESTPTSSASGQPSLTITPETTEDTTAKPEDDTSSSSSSSDDSSSESSSSNDSSSNSSSSNSSEDEQPNDDLTVIPSNANALVLMDVGAQSPKGAPGKVVNVILPMAVNREYLPSERYMLRNITITPDIPTDAKVSNWPFDLINASYVRHLDDMSYNSTATIYYKFRISQFAKKGVYPLNFKVNATVWRKDAANGTSITEDVTFKLCVYVTVTDDGGESGVITEFGPIQLAGRDSKDKPIESPTAAPNDVIKLTLPIVNKGGMLRDITIAPVISASVDEFPFVAENINYGRDFSDMDTGDTETLTYEWKVSPYATSGNKTIKFHVTYHENGVAGQCDFYAYIYIKDGYKEIPNTAPSLMIHAYSMFVNGQEVKALNAGEDVLLKVQLINNARYDTVYKNVAALNLADSKALVLSVGSSDSSYISSIAPGGTAEVEYHISARADAPVGPAVIGLSLNYETLDAVQGTAKQTIMLPVKQPMNLVIDEPVVYGDPIQGEPFSINLNIVNMGRAKVLNLNVLAMEGLSMAESYFGGDVAPAGTHSADIQVVSNKSGQFTGTIMVSYEDDNGEQYSQAIDIPMNVRDAAAVQAALQSQQLPQPEKRGIPIWGILLILLCVLAVGGAFAYRYFVVLKKGQPAVDALPSLLPDDKTLQMEEPKTEKPQNGESQAEEPNENQ